MKNGGKSSSRRRWASRLGVGILGVWLTVGITAGEANTASSAPTASHAQTKSPGSRHHNYSPHPTGAILSGTTRLPARSTLPAGAALPTSVDLSAWTVPVGDQQNTESCVTWAIDYGILGWYSNYNRKPGQPFAPMYTYSQINGGQDDGSSPSDALNIAEQQGSDTASDYSQGAYDWSDQPTSQEQVNAANYKITGWQTLFAGANQGPSADSAIKGQLAADTPVAITLPVRPGFDNVGTGIDTDTTGPIRGYHEVFVLGYNQNGILIQNSWGTGWGNKGYAWLGWTILENDVSEAEVIDGINYTGPGDEPTISSVSFSGSRRAPTVIIQGTGFANAPGGTAAPANCAWLPLLSGSGNDYSFNYLNLTDVTRGWHAGLTISSPDCVGLKHVTYTPTQVILHFGTYYNTHGWTLSVGDTFTVGVASATASATVAFPRIRSMVFTGSGRLPS